MSGAIQPAFQSSTNAEVEITRGQQSVATQTPFVPVRAYSCKCKAPNIAECRELETHPYFPGVNQWFSHCVPRDDIPEGEQNPIGQGEEAMHRQVLQSLSARLPGPESQPQEIDNVITGFATDSSGNDLGVEHVHWDRIIEGGPRALGAT